MNKRFVVNFPEIGEGVSEGEVIEWLKNEGQMLGQDEPVVIVMTDKATVELPSPYRGKLIKQYIQPGQLAFKDKPLYEIELLENHGEIEPVAVQKEVDNEIVLHPPRKCQDSHVASLKSDRIGNALATPKVRQMAKLLGIDLETISGSGKDGRVTIADLSPQQKSPSLSTDILRLPDDEIIPVIGIIKLMSKKMVESKKRIPHFSYFESADVSRLVQLRKHVKGKAEKEGVHLTYMPFIIKAVSLCIKEFPLLNSSYDEAADQLHLHHQHNIGIAISTPLGIIVPVLKGVQSLNMLEIAQAYDELVKKARDNKLLSSDMKEGTMTVSNYGTDGHGLWATPVINYPEVAILAVAKIQEQPVVKNGAIVICEMMNLSWSFDHRIIGGDLAMHISDRFCKLLRNPASLL